MGFWCARAARILCSVMVLERHSREAFRYEGTVIKRRFSRVRKKRSLLRVRRANYAPRTRLQKKLPADHPNHFLKAPT